ncbi:MAG TPA: dimethylmenaquinone methyltransferase, partial [Solibacterales bacterium]|nr:dimethylmenaquinone methyltransferase [Bryobacterales bacterium]
WIGERFEDGRPKVPDEVLQRLRTTTAEEAWGTLRRHRYNLQFAGGFQEINADGKRLVGRVVTAVFVPARPDFQNYIVEMGKKEGRVSSGQNSWVIDTLKPGDVLVVDMFGKIKDGTFIGDNLGTSIWTKTKAGLIVNGSVRDVSGISEIKGFKVFARGVHPSAIADVTLAGINVPIRIGEVTVLPGDVVVSDPEGLTFIPPHLAAEVAEESENTQIRDQWGHRMLREGKYTPGEIDTKWTPAMEAEFKKFAEQEKARRRSEK